MIASVARELSREENQTKVEDNQTKVIDLEPEMGDHRNEFVQFCLSIEGDFEHIKSSEPQAQESSRRDLLNKYRNEINAVQESLRKEKIELLFVKSVILDLLYQGWKLKIIDERVKIYSPPSPSEPQAAKEMIRSGHLLGRDAQLREDSVLEFIKGMERRRLSTKGWHSIFSLMRDGGELTEQLRNIAAITDQERRSAALAKVVSPYLQVVEGDALCEHTGLRLGDIWRYFRHTWVNEYKSVPGRSIMILIRDAAAPNHPVIGIAALGSSVVQHSLRDDWIGWRPQYFVNKLIERPTAKLGRWLLASLESLIGAIYLKDIRNEGLCSSRAISHPSDEPIQALLREAERAIKMHRQNPQKSHHKGQKGDLRSKRYWESEAQTYLYQSKRCRQLAQLLMIRKTFQDHGLKSGSQAELKGALTSGKVKSCVAQLVRMIKAEHVGIDMMDITVCGAVAPYNHLLGGKLVCMLLCSPEITQYYSKRYGDQVSIIASSMKGSPVIRKPNLVLLCTTSLYGVGSSQYNRVRIPLKEVGSKSEDNVSYKDLGHSFGFGTYHFSRETISLGSTLISRHKESRLVNSIFGEGVNPLMRKIREALEIVELPSDAILQHGNRRVTYGIKLAKNFGEVLLGMDQRPSYLIPQSKPRERTGMIADYWRRRWLSKRIDRPDILDEVAQHTLAYPITHGAAVTLPSFDDADSLPLFVL